VPGRQFLEAPRVAGHVAAHGHCRGAIACIHGVRLTTRAEHLGGALQRLAGPGWPFTIERPAELRAEVRALAARLLPRRHRRVGHPAARRSRRASQWATLARAATRPSGRWRSLRGVQVAADYAGLTAEAARAVQAQKLCEAEHGIAHQLFDREVN
jgi:hypothetical protein